MPEAISSSDTIFALATAAGRAGVAIIRISGAEAWSAVETLTGRSVGSLRRLCLRQISWRGQLLDEALVAVFEADASYSGERMAELQLHGGRATISAVLSALSEVEGLRAADPGEFTRRALLNGRMDLPQAEALCDLIDAETMAQREQALAVLKGGGAEKAAEWRRDLIRALALLEASIDFADEEDAPEDVSDEVEALIQALRLELSRAIDAGQHGERVREGFRVALVGAPNAGKSTLLNAIVGRQAAITSPHAGTTRDAIEVACDFNGLAVILQDMAGLRETDDEVEEIGLNLARDLIGNADLRILILAPDAPQPDEVSRDQFDFVVWNKCDLSEGSGDVVLSAKTGEGVGRLIDEVSDRLRSRLKVDTLFPRARQLKRLKEAGEELEFAAASSSPEIVSEHLRRCLSSLDALIGKVDTEDLLDEIFANFCLGK